MPTTTVQKMIGAISILISLMKPSARGLRSAPNPGHSHPTAMPATIATRSWTNSEEYHRLREASVSAGIATSVIGNT
jgi:hypothetical protein